jgi:hypothetical protein
MYTPVSAPEPVLFVLSTNDFFTPLHLEVRCQGDGALIAQFAPGNFFLGAAPGTAWLVTNDGTVSRYELRRGSLAMRVQVPWTIKLTSSTGIVAVEQRIEYPLGQSTARTQGPPTLHVVAPDGTDVFRRSLPPGTGSVQRHPLRLLSRPHFARGRVSAGGESYGCDPRDRRPGVEQRWRRSMTAQTAC